MKKDSPKPSISKLQMIKEHFSMSITAISFMLIVGTGLLEVFEKVKTTGPFMELFITCGSLYLGRRSFDAFLEYKKSKEK